MARNNSRRSFTVGRVVVHLRGSVWYLRYQQDGRRKQIRACVDKEEARLIASRVNADLEQRRATIFDYDKISFSQLQQRWLGHLEHVRRASL